MVSDPAELQYFKRLVSTLVSWDLAMIIHPPYCGYNNNYYDWECTCGHYEKTVPTYYDETHVLVSRDTLRSMRERIDRLSQALQMYEQSGMSQQAMDREYMKERKRRMELQQISESQFFEQTNNPWKLTKI